MFEQVGQAYRSLDTIYDICCCYYSAPCEELGAVICTYSNSLGEGGVFSVMRFCEVRGLEKGGGGSNLDLDLGQEPDGAI